MKLKTVTLLLFFFSVTICTFYSCSDIIEPSIAKIQVTVEAPYNGYSSSNFAVNFWWDGINNALHYRLQIVTPNFDTVASLMLDTLISANKFTFNLTPGKFQWRVRAENGSSVTNYSTPRNLTVLNSSLSQQTVELSAPANNSLTNQSSVVFKWGSLYGASVYRLEIDTNNFQNESAVIYNQTVPGLQIAYTFPKDQNYQWRVRGENDTAQSQWSVVNVITYDHTPPGQVSLSSPNNGQTIALPVQLQWNAVAKATQYKLYVFQSDSVTTYNQTFPMLLNTNNYSFTLGNSGNTIYWKVSAIDAAGNEGATSSLRSFILQ